MRDTTAANLLVYIARSLVIRNPAKILIRPIEIPHKVYAQCRTLMAELGIVHGSFDFAIEPNGNWTFFEVNESGQFLWLESYVPALPILEIATQFFSAPSTDFKWRREGIRSEIVEICQAEEYRELVQKDEENMQNLEMTAVL